MPCITFCVVHIHENRFVLTGLVSKGYACLSNYGISDYVTYIHDIHIYIHTVKMNVAIYIYINLWLWFLTYIYMAHIYIHTSVQSK